MESGPLPRTSRVYIAGHRGLVGSALWRHFTEQGFTDLVGRTSNELDLRDCDATLGSWPRPSPMSSSTPRPRGRHLGEQHLPRGVLL